ncbi:hypothetical protein KKF34_20025 [Myxococcota bacterium]|nr:hypothetical protein [Myxococcota bacterium]MBU1382987.1 hypothetical protein [Myxococcota bacterium]MBU1499177.1 hypothetical protein [Myxococcota bacterium]
MKLLIPFLIVFLTSITSCDNNEKLSTCGDSVVDPGEECDSENFSGRTCATEGFYFGDLACSDDCKIIVTGCEDSGYCGNNRIENDYEDCDTDAFKIALCTGIVGEGFTGGTLGCNDDCTYDTSACERANCGNGEIDEFEDCDGPNLNESTCETEGFYGGELFCNPVTCRFDTNSCTGRCGDGVIQGDKGEDCEESLMTGVTCGTHGYHPGTLECNSCLLDFSLCGGKCGDNIFQPEYEECDDAPNAPTCNDFGYSSGTVVCDSQCTATIDGCAMRMYTSISAGANHTCAIDLSGQAWCWGSNSNGQLGNPSANETENTPVRVLQNASGNFIEVFAGDSFTCALSENFRVWCWGEADFIGTNATEDALEPQQVILPINDVELFTCGNNHCCITEVNFTHCWGHNMNYEAGTGSNDPSVNLLPVQSFINDGFKAFDGGASRTCMITSNDEVKCWGQNLFYSGGLASPEYLTAPTTIEPADPPSGTVVQISSGYYHGCYIDTTNQAYCFGNNDYGQLGDGNIDGNGRAASPVFQSGILFNEISAGHHHTCAISDTWVLYCWGRNGNHQLGTGPDIENQYAPVTVNSALNFTKVSAGTSHTCALDTMGRAWCWGDGNSGQVGVVTPDYYPTPVLVAD